MAVSNDVSTTEIDVDRWSGRSAIGLAVMVASSVAFAWWVGAGIWIVAGQSAPIIELLVNENGGALSDTEWYEHEEAREIFHIEADGQEAPNRFGESVDGDMLYGPILMLKVFASLIALLVAGLVALAAPRRWALGVTSVVILSGVGLIAPLVLYSDTIAAVTSIVE